ncbi:hypothetical protein AVEN_54691-1 [Araneus ventricosus]|uniref:Uncharacterized protein n=1 Tax=Araneus ventricosus TaxID=182803 RepID=A0A4Y2L6M0_ARAVE|nr:hypothetical protein AVEN_54691-1 [Araneus ventricosus]
MGLPWMIMSLSFEPLFRSGSARMSLSANIYNGHRNKASGYPDTKSRPEPCKECSLMSGRHIPRQSHVSSGLVTLTNFLSNA